MKRNLQLEKPTETLEVNAIDILTPDQLADRLQVPVTWVYSQCSKRQMNKGKPIPVLRAGKYMRFYWPDVVAWLRANPALSRERKVP